METVGNKIKQKTSKKYFCEICDYITDRKSNIANHLLTAKHKMSTNGNSIQHKLSNSFYCEKCDKKYKDRTGLWKHKQKCASNTNNDHEHDTNKISPESLDKDQLIITLLKQNAELIKGQQDMFMKVLENGTNNITTNTTHNNNFNLQFFLNETCKNALNIDDFVSSIKVSLSELENTGRRGYIEGISSIIINKLNNLSHCDRPLHCSDHKRETMYIKNDNQWIKETEEKPILKKAIKTIANENIKQINTWRQQNPDCTDSDSKKNNFYLKMVINSMSGSTKEESDKNYEKIISNVAKQVTIDK